MIYDCFLFFNEFDLLDIRLHELSDVVDRFVLLESTRTFTNRAKPLWFQESDCWHIRKNEGKRLAEFRDRIDVVSLQVFPIAILKNPWKVEAYHRDSLIRQLQCGPDDIVMLSDADEIPSKEWVGNLNAGLAESRVVYGEQTLCWYYLNCRRLDTWPAGTRATRGKDLDGGEKLRKSSGLNTGRGAGWHFSYLGDIAEKLRSFSHTEYNKQPYNTPEHIARCKRGAIDLFGRHAKHGPMGIETDLSFLPQYVRDNREDFKKKELIRVR